MGQKMLGDQFDSDSDDHMSTYFSSEFKETPAVGLVQSKFNYCLRSSKVEKIESNHESEHKTLGLTSNHQN